MKNGIFRLHSTSPIKRVVCQSLINSDKPPTVVLLRRFAQCVCVNMLVYFGVAGDLRKRLKQFDNTISRKNTNHGGALRMLNKYRIYDELVPKLYVAIRAIERGPLGGISDTLRRKGDAQQLECHCISSK